MEKNIYEVLKKKSGKITHMLEIFYNKTLYVDISEQLDGYIQKY